MVKRFELISIRRNVNGYYIATLWNIHNAYYAYKTFSGYPLNTVYKLLRREHDCIVSRAAIKKGVQYDTI